jgi:c-di-GMP-binding flagellar brake protein YcgR
MVFKGGYHRHSGNDRRRYQRLDLDVVVMYSVAEPLSIRATIGDREIEATMLNLSLGGMALITEYNIPVWTIIDIRFTLTKINKEGTIGIYGPMKIRGEVRSNIQLEEKEYRLGISFIRIEDKDKVELTEFLKTIIR